MSTSTSIGEQRVFNAAVAGTNDNAGDSGTKNIFISIGGLTDPTSTRVAALDDRKWNPNQFGRLAPERQNILIGSLTTSSATTTAILGTLLNIADFKNAQILVDITATGGTASTLTVFVESRHDGTSWFSIAATPLLTTADKQLITLSKLQAANASTLITALVGAGTVRNIGWADDLRIRYSIEGTTSSFDFRVWINLLG